jgi:hypothetical protein
MLLYGTVSIRHKNQKDNLITSLRYPPYSAVGGQSLYGGQHRFFRPTQLL